MKAYLVGGYVRDNEMNRLLGTNISPKDRDWVVVGSTENEMLNLGFHRVGTFPVFLHPENKEEWALARTEKKIGKGYKGFKVDFSSTVTLEEDLGRRDLTINAIAQEPDTGRIIDPYNGKADILNKVLRHVSPAFVEDPLRVLRVARFAARFNNFTIAPETMTEMKRITDTGELESLVPERVWQEIHSALSENHPEIFFNVLRECNALATIWPELDELWAMSIPKEDKHKNCSNIYPMMVLRQATLLSPKITIRFSALCAALCNGKAPKNKVPNNINEVLKVNRLVENFCDRFKVPNEYKQLALNVCQYHIYSDRVLKLSPYSILKLFNKLDVWRKPQAFENFLIACEAHAKVKRGGIGNTYSQADFLRAAANKCREVNARKFVDQGIQGKAIKNAIEEERIQMIKNLLLESNNEN